LDQKFKELQDKVSEWMVADEDISLAESISRLMRRKKLTMGTAESCTGGYIAHLITSCPGSTDIYMGSVVCYWDQEKSDILDVDPTVIAAHGAVSEQTVRQMAEGARKKLKTDYAIATSGIMGPGGGTEEKPVGTVWICVAGKQGTKAEKRFFRFDRMRNIGLTANAALNMLRLMIIEEDESKPHSTVKSAIT
jgi:nicotinamide-nucleotide amidase